MNLILECRRRWDWLLRQEGNSGFSCWVLVAGGFAVLVVAGLAVVVAAVAVAGAVVVVVVAVVPLAETKSRAGDYGCNSSSSSGRATC